MKRIMGFALLLMALPHSVFAWGGVGHRAVALVAEAKLSGAARAGVQQLLGQETLADVANWADSLKGSDGYRQTVWYHFEKIPDDVSYLDNLRQMPEWQQRKGGIVAAILEADRILRSEAARAEKAVALKFLVHFVGDLMQPLHTGRPEDNGGVKLNVTWMGTPMSLHKVWDSAMITTGHRDLFARTQAEPDQARAYATFLLARGLEASTALDVEGWLQESLALRAAAYDRLFETDQPRYQQLHLPEIDQRVYAGGVRLAALLDDIFAGRSAPPLESALRSRIEAVLGPVSQLISFRP